MNILESVHRSVRRFVFEALDTAENGDERWRVRMQESEMRDDDRPLAVVTPITDVSPYSAPRIGVPAGEMRFRWPFAAVAYPAVDGTARETRRRATSVANVLLDAVMVGLVIPAVPEDPGPAAPSRSYSLPARLPLFDYTDVPVEGEGRTDVPETAVGWLDVLSSSVRPIPDPEDDRRWTVVLSMTVSWWSPGRSRLNLEEEPVVAHVPLTGVTLRY